MAEQEKISPMLKQYREIKEMYPKHILFYRLGDFYEMFFEDAEIVSRTLELALTSRAGAPMCGVPYHSAEIYIKKLIENGYRVAICEQLTDPHASKGLVQRGVVRLVSAGTVIEASMLKEDSNNYIACVHVSLADNAAALVFADISTGDVHVMEKHEKNIQQEIISELSRYEPVELLIDGEFDSLNEVNKFICESSLKCSCERLPYEEFNAKYVNVLLKQFEVNDEKSLGLDDMPLAKEAMCAMFRYLGEMSKTPVKRFTKIKIHNGGEYMGMNLAARHNLELMQTIRTKEKRGSLIWVLDKTSTAMGKRRLKIWLEQPLLSPAAILRRLDAVEVLVGSSSLLYDIKEALNGIYDIERLMTRVMYKSAAPKDIAALGKTCSEIPALKDALSKADCQLIKSINERIEDLSDISSLVDNAIADELPATIREGGVIKEGFNEDIDRLRNITQNAKAVIEEMEERERKSTGIKSLKIGSNKIFGYYIEVSNGSLSMVPDNYIRKQTLTTGERYITEELKNLESEILGANDKLAALEQDIFDEVREYISKRLSAVQEAAAAISEADVLCAFAEVSIERNYVKPEITLEGVIDIKDGRHPVIEAAMSDAPFTPNDAYLDLKANRLIIITGPNMSGKSTFMRQTALIVLMAQIGCFVPARYAKIGVVDKIFTRIGASDDIAGGKSTFMVEMSEVADILKNATKNSLVILDEIGRGTSTFDGISIAKAVAEYISGKNIGCKTLFATHYHELISMEKEYKGVRNFSVAVKRRGDEIQFLHKIIEGGTDDSYGIEVAKLAGLPNKVIARAKEELKELEAVGREKLNETLEKNADNQYSFTALNEQNAIARLRAADINSMAPMEALMLIKEIKETL